MFDALFEFFSYVLFSYRDYDGLPLAELHIFDLTLSFQDYLCYLLTYISLIFIFILCCLFVYKIIKLVGNLIR